MLVLILVVAAAILFILAIPPATARYNLVAAGLACLTLALLLRLWPSLT
jgi:hypothetical protein